MSFANPGDIRIGLKAALAGGVSDPRNETVMKMFSLVDIGERAGSGIPDFINTWTKYMCGTPEYYITHNPERTRLVIPFAMDKLEKAGEMLVHFNKSKSGLTVHPDATNSGLTVHPDATKSGLQSAMSGLSDMAKQIVELMLDDPSITYDGIATKLGKARSGIAKHIKKLVADGVVMPKDANGVWVVNLQKTKD